MRSIKKFLSVLAALALMSAFVTAPVYALPDDSDTVEVIDDPEDEEELDESDTTEEAEDSEAEEIDETEDEEATEEDSETPEDTEAPETDTPPAATSGTASTQAPSTTASPVATTASAGEITYTRTDPYAMYAIENVNVRQGPGTTYSVIGSVVATKEVKVLGTNGGWLAIDYYGGVGFVSASFFTSTAPETTAATTSSQPVTQQTTQAITQDTTQPAAEVPDDGGAVVLDPDVTQPSEPDASIEDDDINQPAQTTAKQEETTAETEATTAGAAATVDNNKGSGGIGGLLIALGCAVGTFLLVGVVPVVIHSIYHKKMYEY